MMTRQGPRDSDMIMALKMNLMDVGNISGDSFTTSSDYGKVFHFRDVMCFHFNTLSVGCLYR